MQKKQANRIMRHKRVRAKISGTAKVPRLCVFRSNCHIYAQLIDDTKGKVMASVNDFDVLKKNKKHEVKLKDAGNILQAKTAVAFKVGESIAEKAKELGIKKVVFDRGGFKFHGRVKAVALGCVEKGLVI